MPKASHGEHSDLLTSRITLLTGFSRRPAAHVKGLSFRNGSACACSLHRARHACRFGAPGARTLARTHSTLTSVCYIDPPGSGKGEEQTSVSDYQPAQRKSYMGSREQKFCLRCVVSVSSLQIASGIVPRRMEGPRTAENRTLCLTSVTLLCHHLACVQCFHALRVISYSLLVL